MGQMSLLGPGTLDTVELTEVYGAEPGGVFDIPVGRDLKPAAIPVCLGDVIVAINALEDYARMLADKALEPAPEITRQLYKMHGARCRAIARRWAAKINYDYDKAIKDCAKTRRRNRRKSDVGEDALAVAAKADKAPETKD